MLNSMTHRLLVPLLTLPLCLFACTDRSTSDDDDDDDQPQSELTYPIVDTNQVTCYDTAEAVACGSTSLGQDAECEGQVPAYQDNGDSTVTDLVTSLMWQQDPGDKVTWDVAEAGAGAFSLAGYEDWRLPTIKELYSLIQYSGTDPSSCGPNPNCSTVPFMDDEVFAFQYGDESAGERMIDSQWATNTLYVDPGMAEMFGVNFADGRIKGYPIGPMPNAPEGKTYFTIYVRGNPDYGANDFTDNGDGTVTDEATGLMWLQEDSGGIEGSAGQLDWQSALSWAEDLEFGGHDDWRLPNAKELQSIVDYTRSPGTTDSAAIDPIFDCTPITDEGGDEDYGFYWSSTTHAADDGSGRSAAYVAFGRALGFMTSPQNGSVNLMDVHGAGAQRSDPKTGDPADWPQGHGPQGDVIRIFNLVRPVRSLED